MGAFRDLTGLRFGRLVVRSLAKTKTTDKSLAWNCVCDCGAKRLIGTRSLNSGNTRSCGCLRTELRSGANNPRARKNIERCGGRFISSKDEWYQSAERIKFSTSRRGIPFGFESAAEFALYLKDIAPERCPVFDEPFERGVGKLHDMSPSVDKIDPSKGYVRGNLQIVSHLANRMKNDATKDQLVKFAVWVLRFVFGKDVQILVKGKTI